MERAKTTVASGLRAFLPKNATQFNRDLVDRFLAVESVETQINPRTDIGAPVDGKPSVRTHDGFDIYPIRIPKSAGTSPDWGDRTLRYPFDKYALEIGATGFSASGSLWVGFDIDTIVGHAAGVGVSDEEIARVDRAVGDIPYVELRRSTRGKGRHIYVLLDRITTANHTEHAALGRAVLGKLCNDADLDFAPSVDCCGGNLWFWSRRANAENRGFELLKAASKILREEDIPGWRDHLDVVQRKTTVVHVAGLDEEDAAGYPRVRKDSEHDRIFAEYQRHGFSLIYQPDHRCYQCHTMGLAKTHRELGLRGAFETISEGHDPGKPNAFAFLRPNGALFIVRYGTSTEHPLWTKTTKGHPCATFNLCLDAKSVCRAVEGVWTGEGFSCAKLEQAKFAARLFGFNLPPIDERPLNFICKPGRVTVEADRKGKETIEGWGWSGRKLKRQFDIDTPPEDGSFDKRYRHVVSPSNEDAGWRAQRDDGTWGCESKDTLKDMLVYDGFAKEASAIIGGCAKRPWTLVNEPFQPEFLSGRRWNRGRKLLYTPSQGTDLSHPHFDKILKQCGQGLDEAVIIDPWCIEHGVTSGAGYLLLWAAALIQQPKHPLPYLFLFSPENNTGKSSLYRALGMLFEGGATDVHAALMETFNHQLAGAVLCCVEERSLNSQAYQKLKSWVDSPTISIREMRTNAYTLPNYAHFIQTANALDACPVEKHDERVVVIRVPVLDQLIPWTTEMVPALQREASDFLATLLTTPLPPAAGRLFLPVLETADKRAIVGIADNTHARKEVVNALADRIVNLLGPFDCFKGFGEDLLNAIGPGQWKNSPGTVVGYLQDAVDELRRRGFTVSFANRKHGQREITIGRSWLIETEWSDEEMAADEERVAMLLE
jgi:hypothetical protein